MGEQNEEEMIMGAQVLRLLNISKATLRRWRLTGKIKYIELPNNRFRYPKSEIETILANGRT